MLLATERLIRVAASDAEADAKRSSDLVAAGRDDQNPIQDAIDSFSAAGGTVRLSPGTFHLDAPIVLADGVTLEGAGTKTLLLLNPAKNSLGRESGILLVTGKRVRVSRLCIDGSLDDNRTSPDHPRRSSGVYLGVDSADAVIEDLEVRSTTRHGVAVLGRGHLLRNIRAYRTGMYGFSFGGNGCFRPGVWGCRAENLWTRDSGQRSGIEVNDGVDGLTIDGFYCGGHGGRRGAIHLREHGRRNEFIRNVIIRNGVIDLSDFEIEYREPMRNGITIISLDAQNPFERLLLESIEFRHVPGDAVQIIGNASDVSLRDLTFRDVQGRHIFVDPSRRRERSLFNQLLERLEQLRRNISARIRRRTQ